GLRDAVQISTDENATCALRRDGTVQCWGVHLEVEGAKDPQLAPLTVRGLSGAKAIGGSCAIKSNGEVWCWSEKGIAAVASLHGATGLVDGSFPCALVSGTPWCWRADVELTGDSIRA